MLAWYPVLKPLHITLALSSGGLFALRGALRLCGAQWVLSTPVRYGSIALDTALLTSALILLSLLPGALFANGWLAAKLLWLVAYIVLGSLALRQARSRRQQVVCFIAALLAFGQMLAIARSHHPLGIAASLIL